MSFRQSIYKSQFVLRNVITKMWRENEEKKKKKLEHEAANRAFNLRYASSNHYFLIRWLALRAV